MFKRPLFKKAENTPPAWTYENLGSQVIRVTLPDGKTVDTLVFTKEQLGIAQETT